MQTHLTEVSKLVTKSPKCPATTGNNMATKQTSPDLWMFFEPLLLDPFLACCHPSQCQLPESRSSEGLRLPAKPEPALGSHQEPTPPAACRFSFTQLWWTARFSCFAQTPQMFLSVLCTMPWAWAGPKDRAAAAAAFLAEFSCYGPKQCHAGSAFCTCSPLLHTQRVPKTYTSGYNKAKKGTGSEPNFVYYEDKAANCNCSAL